MPKFKLGTYKVKCDRTGGTFRSDMCRTTWDNLLAYEEFVWQRNPQDKGMTMQEKQSVPHGRPNQSMAITQLREFNRDFNHDFD